MIFKDSSLFLGHFKILGGVKTLCMASILITVVGDMSLHKTR